MNKSRNMEWLALYFFTMLFLEQSRQIECAVEGTHEKECAHTERMEMRQGTIYKGSLANSIDNL
jgi:hypothetical protein